MLAFGTLIPLSLGIVALLVILVFSYRQTIKAYPSAGGAYIVTRDNFGVLPAQVAGVALLTDYILTVAVSVSAGVAALYSRSRRPIRHRVQIAALLIWVIVWMNLRGVKESGWVFVVPTYGFVVAIIALVIVGFAKAIAGGLDPIHVHHVTVAAGAGGSIGIFLVLHAFAGGSTAMTGVEAISNGVPAFKPVEWKNARRVLAWLGVLLAVMFLGISFLAWKLHPIPNTKETVISQITRAVVGTGTLGNIAFFFVQAMTMLILVLAANTSFADFPRLASFHAEDHFLPSPLTKRGRRLVFANGIVVLAGVRHPSDRRVRGERHPPHPALRHRRVHVVHALAGRDGEAPPHAQGAGLEDGPVGERHRRRRDRRRRDRDRGDEVHARRVDSHARRAADRGGARAGQQALRPRRRQARRARPDAGHRHRQSSRCGGVRVPRRRRSGLCYVGRRPPRRRPGARGARRSGGSRCAAGVRAGYDCQLEFVVVTIAGW